MIERLWHVGRSWGGPGPKEAGCPCLKEECGLVRLDQTAGECEEHGVETCKTLRVGHVGELCPGSGG